MKSETLSCQLDCSKNRAIPYFISIIYRDHSYHSLSPRTVTTIIRSVPYSKSPGGPRAVCNPLHRVTWSTGCVPDNQLSHFDFTDLRGNAQLRWWPTQNSRLAGIQPIIPGTILNFMYDNRYSAPTHSHTKELRVQIIVTKMRLCYIYNCKFISDSW